MTRENTSVVCEQLRAAYSAIEEMFRESKLSGPAWISLGDDAVGFDKHGSRWTVVYKRHDWADPKPILECSISDRVRASEYIPLLYAEMKKMSAIRLKDIQRAAKILTEFCDEAKEDIINDT